MAGNIDTTAAARNACDSGNDLYMLSPCAASQPEDDLNSDPCAASLLSSCTCSDPKLGDSLTYYHN